MLVGILFSKKVQIHLLNKDVFDHIITKYSSLNFIEKIKSEYLNKTTSFIKIDDVDKRTFLSLIEKEKTKINKNESINKYIYVL
jgi:Mg2+ and Co2+ transporter CorA